MSVDIRRVSTSTLARGRAQSFDVFMMREWLEMRAGSVIVQTSGSKKRSWRVAVIRCPMKHRNHGFAVGCSPRQPKQEDGC